MEVYMLSNSPVTNVSINYNVALITIDNLPSGKMFLIPEIFNSIAEQNINIDMISQAPPYRGVLSLSFTLPSADLVKAISVLNNFKKQVPSLSIEINAENTKLSVYGEQMKNIPGVAARLFTIFSQNGVDIKLVTTSEVDISYLIDEKDVDRALSAIKAEYGI